MGSKIDEPSQADASHCVTELLCEGSGPFETAKYGQGVDLTGNRGKDEFSWVAACQSLTGQVSKHAVLCCLIYFILP